MTILARTLKYAVQDFYRNFWLTLITITVVFIALFTFNSLLLVQTVSDYSINTIEKKIDVSVFIKPGIDQNIVQDLKNRLLSLQEVKDVIYITPDEALNGFMAKYEEDETIIQSVEELEVNPLGAQLIVQAQSAQQYQPIVDLLLQERFDAIIADKNFEEHSLIIQRVSSISERVRTIATVLSIIFGFIAIIVVYNTLRVIIYTHKEKIAIMRLVGASNIFIRLPYLWQVMLYSIVAIGLFLLVWYPLLGIVEPYINDIFADTSRINLVNYYNANFIPLFGSQFIFLIIFLGITSILATKKYSKV